MNGRSLRERRGARFVKRFARDRDILLGRRVGV